MPKRGMGLLKKIKGTPDRKRAQALVEKGLTKKSAGDTKGALKHYQNAAKKDPTYVVARYNEGLALLDLYHEGQEQNPQYVDDARSAFALACELDHEHYSSFRMHMHTSARVGRFVDAKTSGTHILSKAPAAFVHRAEVENLLATIAQSADDEALITNARRLLEHSGDEEDLEKHLEALDTTRSALEQYSQSERAKPIAQLLSAECSLGLGDIDAAIESYRQATKGESAAKAHRALSNLYAQKGDAKSALPHALYAYKDEPTDAARVCNVGVCYLELGDSENAQEYLRIAKGLDPQNQIVARAEERLEALLAKQGTL